MALTSLGERSVGEYFPSRYRCYHVFYRRGKMEADHNKRAPALRAAERAPALRAAEKVPALRAARAT
jgi:hypothetical protein